MWLLVSNNFLIFLIVLGDGIKNTISKCRKKCSGNNQNNQESRKVISKQNPNIHQLSAIQESNVYLKQENKKGSKIYMREENKDHEDPRKWLDFRRNNS